MVYSNYAIRWVIFAIDFPSFFVGAGIAACAKGGHWSLALALLQQMAGRTKATAPRWENPWEFPAIWGHTFITYSNNYLGMYVYVYIYIYPRDSLNPS